MGPRMIVSLQEIDEALTHVKGHRAAAAQILKINVEKLKCLIHDNPILNGKWSREATNVRARQEARIAMGLPAHPVKPLDKVKAMLVDLERESSYRLNKLLTRAERVALRIEKGEEAEFSEDPKIKRYAFPLDANGAPATEKMLRESLAEMTKQALAMKKDLRETLWTLNKMEFMDRKYQGNGGPNGAKKAKVGFVSKAERMAVPNQVIDEIQHSEEEKPPGPG